MSTCWNVYLLGTPLIVTSKKHLGNGMVQCSLSGFYGRGLLKKVELSSYLFGSAFVLGLVPNPQSSRGLVTLERVLHAIWVPVPSTSKGPAYIYILFNKGKSGPQATSTLRIAGQ